jgi:adenylate kinase
MLGLPGAGKGTQAARLKEERGLAHVTTGGLFRENIRADTELGQQAKPYVESGKLVPDELTIKMLLERIQRDDCRNGCMFDGYPRNLEQARTLDAALKAEGKQIDRAIYIKVGTEELVSRLAGRWNCRECGAVYHEVNQPPQKAGVCDKCGSGLYQREDDKPDVVRTRLQVNLEQMEQLVEHYRAQGKLVDLDGQREPDEVTRELKSLVAA